MYRVVFLLLFSTASAQLIFEGACNFTALVSDYNASIIVGSWFQLERVVNMSQTGECSTTTFTLVIQNGKFKGYEVSNIEVANGKLIIQNGTISHSTSYPENVLNFTFGNVSYDYVVVPPTPYQYESLLLYRCQTDGDYRSVSAWKLGRTQVISPEAKNATDEVIASIDDLVNATWRVTSFAKASCKNNSALNHIYPLLLFLTALILVMKKNIQRL